jgi:hypothetical protein
MWNSNIYWQDFVVFLIEMTYAFLPHFYYHKFLIVLDNQTHHNLLSQWTVNFSFSTLVGEYFGIYTACFTICFHMTDPRDADVTLHGK